MPTRMSPQFGLVAEDLQTVARNSRRRVGRGHRDRGKSAADDGADATVPASRDRLNLNGRIRVAVSAGRLPETLSLSGRSPPIELNADFGSLFCVGLLRIANWSCRGSQRVIGLESRIELRLLDPLVPRNRVAAQPRERRDRRRDRQVDLGRVCELRQRTSINGRLGWMIDVRGPCVQSPPLRTRGNAPTSPA